MQSLTKPRDPAPSRWAYRMQRLWLTPVFRVLFRLGMPVLVLALGVGLVLADAGRRDALAAGLASLRDKVQERPEFQVTLISVEGASADLADAVRDKLGLAMPISSFEMDLDGARARAESLDAVAAVELRVRSGGVLQVLVTERDPVAIWRQADGLQMLDATGFRVAGLKTRADRPDLPLLAGDGADLAMPEALDILAAAGPLTPRLRGLVRMGQRRWDIVLDRDQRILLPAANPVAAVERLLALDQAEDLIARDIASIDLRNEHRPVLRLAPFALGELRKAQGIKPVETNL